MEIERRFLIAQIPDLSAYSGRRLEQSYISTDPVIRVRRDGDHYILTCKGKGLLAREEFELPLTPDAYERLQRKTEGNRIVKDRYRIPWGGYVIELDIYAPPFAPLNVAEVEFPDEAAALAFTPPEWFGREITYDPAYTNAALSERKFPES